MSKSTPHIGSPARTSSMTARGRALQRKQIDALNISLRLAVLDNLNPTAASANAVNAAIRRVNGLGARIETQRILAAQENLSQLNRHSNQAAGSLPVSDVTPNGNDAA